MKRAASSDAGATTDGRGGVGSPLLPSTIRGRHGFDVSPSAAFIDNAVGTACRWLAGDCLRCRTVNHTGTLHTKSEVRWIIRDP